MAMLPIFVIGLLVGIALSYAWYMYKKDVPSEVKIKLQEADIIRYKSDIETLKQKNETLEKTITELKNKSKKTKIER